MKTKPLPFQRRGVRKIQRFNGRALLADDMGLGKSFQSLLYAYENEKFPVIIVCEAGLKHNWEREARTHLGLRSEVLEGTRPPANKRLTTAKIVIVNYDILGPWLPYLKSLKAKLIIVDEVQKIKNRKAKRTKNFKKLCRRAKHIVALSGTPLESRPAELFPILNILRPDVFPSFFTYAARYCKPRRRPWGWEYKGATNLKELNELLRGTCMIRRTKKEVLDQLPDKLRSIVIVDIKDRDQYNHAVEDFISWLKKKGKAKSIQKLKRAQRLVKAGYLKRLTAELKLDAVIEWIDNFLETSDEKMIFFTYHKAIMKRLVDRYRDKCCYINGSVIGRKRQHAVDEFNLNKRKRLMFGQLEAASKGWSAKNCSNVGVIEFGWLPGLQTQAEDRIHGIGRGAAGKKAHIRYFVAHNTMEEGLVKLLQERQGILEEVLDGREGVGEDLDIFNLFEKLMLKEGRLRK